MKYLSISLFIILQISITPLIADWEPSWNSMDSTNYYFNSFTVKENLIFGGSDYNQGVYVSSNNGYNWVKKINGLTNQKVFSLSSKNDLIVAGTLGNGVFVSTDNGENWQGRNNGLGNNGADIFVMSIFTQNNFIIAGTDQDGVYISSDNGLNWNQRNNGIFEMYIHSSVIYGNSFFVSSFAYSSNEGYLYLSKDFGLSWTKINTGFHTGAIQTLKVKGDRIYAGTNQAGLLISDDGGNTWNQSNNGLTNNNIFSITFKKDLIFVGTTSGIFVSSNNGSNWVGKNKGLDDSTFAFIIANDNAVVLNNFKSKKVYLSINNGDQWISSNDNLKGRMKQFWWHQCNLSAIDSLVFAVTKDPNLYVSTDHGDNWNLKLKLNYEYSFVWSDFVRNGKYIYHTLGTDGWGYTSDEGQTWMGDVLPQCNNTVIFPKDNYLFMGTTDCKMMRSSDNGKSWEAKTNGFVGFEIMNMHIAGNMIIVGNKGYNSGGEFAFSYDNGENWIQKYHIGNTDGIGFIKSIGNRIFAHSIDGIIMSTDGGDSWTQKQKGIPDSAFTSMIVVGNKLFVSSLRSGVYMSIDYGESWLPVNQGLPSLDTRYLTIGDKYIFVVSETNGIYRRKIPDFVISDISDNSNSSNSIISPNPASDYITIQNVISNEVRNPGIEIFNIFGEKVEQTFLSVQDGQTGMSDPLKIDISNLAPGVYFIKIGGKFEKFIKW